MSAPRRVSPEEAKALLDEGHAYLDVRTEEEFAGGHVPGAYNVPIRIRGPAGMAPNPDFVAVVSGAFPPDAKLVVGCQSGPRTIKAVEALTAAGYTELVEFRTGFEGSRDAFGRVEPGWAKKGFPVETETMTGRGYGELLIASKGKS